MHAKCVRTCLFTFWVSEFLVTILRVVAGCRTEQGNARKDASSTTKNEIAMLSENFPNLAPNQRVSAVGKHNKTWIVTRGTNKIKEGRQAEMQRADQRPGSLRILRAHPAQVEPAQPREKGKGRPGHKRRRPATLLTPDAATRPAQVEPASTPRS